MMKRIFAGLFILMLAGSSMAKMNVVLIMADDSAADNYGCYGSTFFKTPILDQLAASGAKFTHCYSEPVCTPSRVKIMTGRDGIRNYAQFGTLDKGETTFGTMMKNAGYATAIAGKWQLHGGSNGSLAPDCGFDTFCLWNYPGGGRDRFWNPSIIRDGTLLETTKEDYGPDIFTDFIIDFIATNKQRPFFVYYPMVLVHSPFLATPDSKSMDGVDKKEKAVLYFRDMTTYADKCVGKIVDALEKNGLREKTVVIYTTDNGTGRGLTYPFKDEQRDGEKAYATDGGSHAPLIINCPGTVPKGIVSDDMVDFSDMMPTLADITSAALPKVPLDGRSFWPQCQGKKGNPRKWIFQYYYPKFTAAAEPHGQGINGCEIVWAQNQHYKLYRDGTLYATADRHETKPIAPGKGGERAETARRMLQEA
ncbi:MAG: sulfatase-like hydrolase/transferase, partial [Kiritimatiellales bacterium]|nr:sulfatase-like hydrolase/transferase [Kiritimatiellales bacterium]